VLRKEIDDLESRGVSTATLKVSGQAHLIMPYHIMLDHIQETRLGKGKIGTTGRGIGPAYSDKAARQGVRMQDVLDPAGFRERVMSTMQSKAEVMVRTYDQDVSSLEADCERYIEAAESLRSHVDDTALLLWKALREEKAVLLEGAQGTLLDLDHGTYPERLPELAPRYLASAPVDPFGLGKPLRYKRLDNGRFLLYSRGPDLRDNGGTPGKWSGAPTRGDIVAGKE
jgi:adenylosuccinate synthase